MPDGAIVLPDTAAAPKDYTLVGAQEIQLKSVRALIDGSAAGSAFLPTLQLLDQNGHVCWEGPANSTVAAGGSADVSWFPGLGKGGSTAAAGTLPTGYVTRSGSFAFVVGSHVQSFNAGNLKTNDSSVWSVDGGTSSLTCSHGGVLRTDISMAWSTTAGGLMSGSYLLRTDVQDSLGGAVEAICGGGNEWYYPALYDAAPPNAFIMNGVGMYNCDDTFYTPPYHIFYEVQAGSVNITATKTSLAGTILNPTGLT